MKTKNNKKSLVKFFGVIAVAIFLYFSLSSDNKGLQESSVHYSSPVVSNQQEVVSNRRGRYLYDPQDTNGLGKNKQIYNKFLESAANIVKKTGNLQADSLIRYANKFSRICIPVDQFTVRSLEPVDTGAYFLPIIITEKNDYTLPSYWLQYGQHEQGGGAFDYVVCALVIMPDASTSLVDQGMTIIHELQHAHANYWQPYNHMDYAKKYEDERRSYELEFALYAAYGGEAYERALVKEMNYQQRMLDSLQINLGEFIGFSKSYDYDLDRAFDKANSPRDQVGRMTRLSMAAVYKLMDIKYRDNVNYRKAFYTYGWYVAMNIDEDGHQF